ncbi:MAG TPA: DMT family transporter [Solirubrobacteraceae bacterium]|nr:DMT family transporter [Solirubrobacteraceae bacterium]
MQARVDRAVAVAVLSTLLLWASAFVAIRFAGRQFGPGELALGRLLVGSLALGVLVVARHERLPRGRPLVLAVVSGVLWFGVYNVALNAAERRIDAGTAALLVNTGPVFVALLAGFALREGFPRGLLGGCVVSLAGVALIAAGVSRHGLEASWGAALCILAAVAYAVGLVAQKPALRSVSALSLTWTACTVAAVCCLPWTPGLLHELGRARTSGILWTVYLGLFPTAVGFGSWAFALARIDAGRLGVTTYLVPPLTVLLGWAALGETPPLLALPGGALCLAGVALARRRSADRKPQRILSDGGPAGPPSEPAASSVRATSERQPA